MLEKISQLSEAVKDTGKGKIHTAEPGGYGRKDDEDDEGKKVKADAPKKGRGRPKKDAGTDGETKTYDTKSLSSVFGGGKAPKNAKKGTVVKGKAQSHASNKEDDGTDVEESKSKKKGLKEYFDSLDKALLEAEQIQIKPASQMPKTPGQTAGATSKPGQPQQVAGQPAKNTQVIAQGNKTLGTVDNPQLAQQIKQSIGKGEMTLMPDQQMAEDGDYSAKKARAGKDIGKPGKNFAKIVKSAGGGEKGKRIAGAVLAKLRGHTNEAVSPVHDGDMGAGLGAGRDQDVLESSKPDFIDLDKDGNKKESMKKAAQDKKKKVKEGMEQRLQAAKLEGRAHGLKGHAHCGKNYDDMEEARMYHEGYKEGLDECYGQMPIAGGSIVGEAPSSTVDDMASFGAHTPAMEDEMEEGNAFTGALAKTPKGGKFSVGGKTFTDNSSLEESPFAFESLEKQLSALLESKEEVAEGLTVSISKGQQGAPDSVSVNAQDGEADQLLQFIKQAGLGIFGGEEQHQGQSSPMSLQPADGGPEAEIDVVGDHDGMMDLIKKVTGGAGHPEVVAIGGDSDYEDEEGHEEHEHTDEGTCNECGMMETECGCDHDDKEMVDEVESEDQMTYNVAEDNPPDNGSANSTNDEVGNANANQAAAEYDQAEAGEEEASDEAVEEDDTSDLDPDEEQVDESLANGADDTFEADINFMTKVISGGLNKQKATGQTTTPVLATQFNRMHSHDTTDVNESISDWKALAGIK